MFRNTPWEHASIFRQYAAFVVFPSSARFSRSHPTTGVPRVAGCTSTNVPPETPVHFRTVPVVNDERLNTKPPSDEPSSRTVPPTVTVLVIENTPGGRITVPPPAAIASVIAALIATPESVPLPAV